MLSMMSVEPMKFKDQYFFLQIIYKGKKLLNIFLMFLSVAK